MKSNGALIALALSALMACNLDRASAESPAPREAPKASGTLAVCNQQSESVYLIDLATGKVARRLEVPPGPHEVAVSPDQTKFAVTIYGTQTPGNQLTLIGLPEGKILKTIDLGQYTRPHGVQWIDGDRVAVTSETTRNVVIVNVKDGKVEKALPTGQAGSHMLALSPDGKRVYTANIPSGTVSVIDMGTSQKIKDIPVTKPSEGIAISPDGRWVWTGNLNAQTVSIVDTEQLEYVKDLPAMGHPYRVTFSLDGSMVYVPCPAAGELAIFDAKKMEPLRKVSVRTGPVKFETAGPPPGPTGTTTHPDGKLIYCSVGAAGAIAIIDPVKGEVLGKLEAGKSPDGLAVSKLKLSAQ